MNKKTFLEISENYNLEIGKIAKTIKKQKANKVLLQFPEGLKPYSLEIADEIEKITKCKCFIWLDSCFGACDIPIEVKKLGIGLIIQFGHSPWDYKRKDIEVLK